MSFVCTHCDRSFIKETSLVVHVCEQKRRQQEKDEPGVVMGFQAYLRFYEFAQGSSKLKAFDDFAKSNLYKAFVNFGRHCQSIKAINVPRFVDWVLANKKKIDHWCKDSIYLEYLLDYLKKENIKDALTRAEEQALRWHEETNNPAHDYLRFGNENKICYAITTGRISAWVLYNTDSGIELLSRLNQEQLSIIWPFVDTDFWGKKFTEYAADAEYIKATLTAKGW